MGLEVHRFICMQDLIKIRTTNSGYIHIRKTAAKSLGDIEIIVISRQTLAQRTLKPSSFQVVNE